MKVAMSDSPKAPPEPVEAAPSRPRAAPQYLLGALLLAYGALGWRYAGEVFRLVSMGIISEGTFLVIFAGSASLLVGVARHLFNARKGGYFLLCAALLLANGAFSIGNWDYLIGKILAGVVGFGSLVAVLGAWQAWRAR